MEVADALMPRRREPHSTMFARSKWVRSYMALLVGLPVRACLSPNSLRLDRCGLQARAARSFRRLPEWSIDCKENQNSPWRIPFWTRQDNRLHVGPTAPLSGDSK